MARPKLGETDTERMQLKITSAEIAAIDDWRYANRVPNRSEAVRRLCKIATTMGGYEDQLQEASDKLFSSVTEYIEFTYTDEFRALEAKTRLKLENMAKQMLASGLALIDQQVARRTSLVPLHNGDDISKDFETSASLSKIFNEKSFLDRMYDDPSARKELKRRIAEAQAQKRKQQKERGLIPDDKE